PDRVLIGGMDLWRSDDGCTTYQAVGGYIGPVAQTHPDMQELRVYQTGPDSEEVWIGCDGGVYHSTDFVQSHAALCRGLEAINLWGYDQGWNDDIRVGGRYHSGNMGMDDDDYPDSNAIALGGGEAPTGYVNYSDQRKTYFSDIDGKVMPASLSQPSVSFPMSFDPNESYYNCSSSRILFDDRYFNVAWSGKDNILYKSTNGGSAFSPFHAFGTIATNPVLWIDQSYADPKIFTVQQAIGNSSVLWRTVDDGATWSQLTLPSASRNLYFTLGSENPGDIWVGYKDRPNGQKVYHSADGGMTWTNLTTSTLDGEQIWSIAYQYGTDGGVYLGLLNGRVLYRNNTMADWAEFSTGLPAGSQPLRLVPFYRDGKIRLACWNLGVWERDLYEPSTLQAGFAAAYGKFFCAGDSIHFVDHSVCDGNATYAWSFPGATPSTSTGKYPTVTYAAAGQYDVSLTVTDNGQVSTATSTAFISEVPGTSPPLVQGFESGSFPSDWIFHTSNGLPSGWAINDEAGGFGNSAHSMLFDNYNTDIQGGRDEVWLGKLDLSQALAPKLWFDVSYARWGAANSDTLAVNISTDCGATWAQLYLKGGQTLATSPDFQSYFIPTADQWRTDTVQLSNYAGANDAIIAFQNRGYYGNVIRVDNINLSSVANVGIPENLSAVSMRTFPNPAHDQLNIALTGAAPGPETLRVLDALGRVVLSEKVAINGATW
ncbi:MAG: PKD domain-containing protein, partial [Flavobacteriales bacterium]